MPEPLPAGEKILLLGRPLPKRGVFLIWMMATLPLVAALMGPSITNALVTDDYWWLWRLGPAGVSPLKMMPGSGHYSPTVQVILALMYRLFGIHGAPYHALTLALYWLGAVGVALLGWRLTKSMTTGLLSGTLVLVNHQPAQIYVWAVGIWYPVSTIFFLIGFWGYLIAVCSKGRQAARGYFTYLGGVILGLLTHEQGWTLVVITALHAFLLVDKDGDKPIGQVNSWPKLVRRVLFFLPPLLLTLGAAVTRYLILGEKTIQPLPQFPVYEAWLSILRSFLPGLSRATAARLSLGLAGRLGLDIVYQILLFVLQYTFLLIIFMLVNRNYKFFLLWTGTQVIMLLYGLGFLFPRHYYLATVPSIILWSCVGLSAVEWVKRRLDTVTPRFSQIATATVIVVAALGIFFTQVPEHLAFQYSWRVATEASNRTLQTIKKLASDNPGADKLIVLNLPDTLISTNLEWIGVFNAGTVEGINFYVPGRFQSISLMRTPLDQHPSLDSGLPSNITQPHLPNLYFGVGQDVSFSQVQSFVRDPTFLVVQFDTRTMDVFQVKAAS